MASHLPDVAPVKNEVYRVCYQHNGQPLDQGEQILPGIQGKFETRQEAELSRQSCLRWFNYQKSVEIVEGKERFHVRERSVVHVWIEHFLDNVLQGTDRPAAAPKAAVSIMEQPRGMTFATLLHEMLCEDFANTADEAAAIMDRHADFVADSVAGGTSLKNLRACAAMLEEKERECRENEKPKETAPKKPKKEEAPVPAMG